MNDNFEKKTIKIIPLSPIHISGGNPRYGSVDIFLPDENLIITVNEDALASFLNNNNKMGDYIKFTSKWTNKNVKSKAERETIVSNTELNDKKVKHNQEYVKSNILKVFLECWCEVNVDSKFLEKNNFIDTKYFVNNTNESFIIDGKKDPYIPGSSIKGAIRTAIAWRMLKDKSYDLNKYIEKLKHFSGRIDQDDFNILIGKIKDTSDKTLLLSSYDLNNDLYILKQSVTSASIENITTILKKYDRTNQYWKRGNMDSFFDEMNELLFEDYKVTYPINGSSFETVINKKALTDFMKCIHISDSNKVLLWEDKKNGHNKKFMVEVYKLQQPDKLVIKNGAGINKEVIYRNNTIAINVVLDLKMLSQFSKTSEGNGFVIPFKSIDDILNIVSIFYDEVWTEENTFWNMITTGEKNVLTKIKQFYFNDPESKIRFGFGSGLLSVALFTLLNDTYRKEIRNLIKDRGNEVAPKTRRIAFLNNNEIKPMGWAKIDFDTLSTFI